MILTLTRSKLPPDIDVLALSGRLIMGNNSRDVELALNDLLPASRKIIFDLADLTMIDSTGVGILVVSHGRINKEGAHLRIAGAHGLVEKLLKMTNVDKLINCYPNVDSAAAAF